MILKKIKLPGAPTTSNILVEENGGAEPVILYGNQTYGRNIYRTQADYNSNINPITATEFVSEKYYDAFLENRLFIVDDGNNPIPYEGLHRGASLVVQISLNSNNDNIVLNSIWYCENSSSSESLSES